MTDFSYYTRTIFLVFSSKFFPQPSLESIYLSKANTTRTIFVLFLTVFCPSEKKQKPVDDVSTGFFVAGAVRIELTTRGFGVVLFTKTELNSIGINRNKSKFFDLHS